MPIESGNDSQLLIEGHHFHIYDGPRKPSYEEPCPKTKNAANGRRPVTLDRLEIQQ